MKIFVVERKGHSQRKLRICLDTAYCWKLKTYYWKYHSKIIFKYVNSTMGPNFKQNLHFSVLTNLINNTQTKEKTQMQTWVVFSAIQTQLSTHLDTNEKLTSAFQCFFFFFFFWEEQIMLFQWVPCNVHRLASILFSNFFIKNWSYSTIYIFKNYFITVFLVFIFHFLTVSNQKIWKKWRAQRVCPGIKRK